MHGNNIETVTLRNAPINSITYPKKGMVKATTTVLITNTVLIVTLIGLLLGNESAFSIALAIGVMTMAYLVRGFISVVYIASFELNFPVGRFRVT